MFTENKTEVSEFYNDCLVISLSAELLLWNVSSRFPLANHFNLLDSQPIFVCDLRISGSHI